jgi:hypothetical protein
MRRLVADRGGCGRCGLGDHLAAEHATEPVGLAVSTKAVAAQRLRLQRMQQAVERTQDGLLQTLAGKR